MPTYSKMLEDGRTAYYLDNSLLSSFTSCARKFELAHVKNLRQKGASAAFGAMQIGSWWSDVMEMFYVHLKGYQNGVFSAPPTKDDLIEAAETAWFQNGFQAMYECASDYQRKRFDGFNDALVMASQYWDFYQSANDVRNWKIVASELTFGYDNSVCVGENESIVVYWCGKPDLVILEAGTDTLMPVDHKTVYLIKGNFLSNWKPHSQTAGYIYAIQQLSNQLGYNRRVNRCLINAAARSYSKTGKGTTPRFQRVTPHYNDEELQEWKRETFLKATALHHALTSNTFIKNESSCHIYGGCPYREIDSYPPSVRPDIEFGAFVEVEPWNPGASVAEEEGAE